MEGREAVESGGAAFSTGISEVALAVGDVAAAAKFYRDVVGLVPEMVSDRFASMWTGPKGQWQRLLLLSRSLRPLPDRTQEDLQGVDMPEPGPRDLKSFSPNMLGTTHFALQVSRRKLDEAVEHLRSNGVEVWGPIHFEWMRSISYNFFDPDGNLVEFWSPDP